MVSSVDSDSVSECHVSTHSATGSTIEPTDSLLKFKSLMDFCVGHVSFWLVFFGHFIIGHGVDSLRLVLAKT